MSRDPDTTKPPDHYAWMADIPNDHGRMQRVALVATPPGGMPQPLASPDLSTILSLKGVAQQAADSLETQVVLYAFRGEEVLQAVQPQRIRQASAVPELPPTMIIDPTKHN